MTLGEETVHAPLALDEPASAEPPQDLLAARIGVTAIFFTESRRNPWMRRCRPMAG